MLEDYLVQTCEIVTATRNAYGDYVYSSGVTENCKFREISEIRRGTNQELDATDAMIWLSSSTTAVNGSIIKFDSVYYQVEKIIKAQRLGETDVQFIKAKLKINKVAIS
jgi:hypothetical protein